MIFTENEQAFIRQRHSDVGLETMQDTRKLGCPESLYLRIIEQRAAKISGKLREFRASQPVPTADSSLEQSIQASKLF